MLVVIALAAAGFVEAPLLRAFVSHPALGPTDSSTHRAFLLFVSWAAVPLLLAMLVTAMAYFLRRPFVRFTRPLLFVAAIGPVFSFIALRQVGDGGFSILVIGFLIQCIAVFFAGFKMRNAN